MKPLIVGEAPSRSGCLPLEGRVGARLAEWSGLSMADYRRRFARANVLPAWPGPSGRKGSRFPVAVAMEQVPAIARRFVRGRIVVLLGKRVARAFGLTVGYFEPVHFAAAAVVVVPHPSGVNHWFNDPRNVDRMRRFMAAIARA